MHKFIFLKNKLHILFICGWYPSRVLPNNGDFIQRHANAVSKQHKVSTLHIITDKNSKKNIELVIRKKEHVQEYIAYVTQTKNPVKKAYLFFKSFIKILHKMDAFDIIHLNEIYPFGIFSVYLKWFYKKPFIISEHFTGYHHPFAKNISINRKLISKIITKNAAFICPVSEDLKNSLLNLGFKGNYKIVPNVVDTKIFYPIENTSNAFKIVHISNMINKHKNIKGILRVVKQIQDEISNLEFMMIGNNSEEYINYAKELNLDFSKIKFISQIEHYKVAQEIRTSNLFVLFSNYENLPCVILEAFSCGIPVISTNVGGIKEYFPKDFGKLISIKDEDELAKQILLSHNNFVPNKTKMHQYAIDNFSEEKITLDFEKLYLKTLNISSETN